NLAGGRTMSDREKAERSGGAAPPKNSDGGGGGGGELRDAALRRRQLDRRAGAPSEKPDAVATRAIREKGPGEALPAQAQKHLGGAYGKDLGDVRVHNDPKSQAAADQAGAEAFTYGKDVFFGSGRYNPSSEHGQFVLAHELAHVAQQGDHPTVQHKKVGAHGGDEKEREADDAAHDALETGHSGDAQEEEASSAADLALSGGRAKLSRASSRIRFFAQGDGTKNRGGHAYMTERALAGMGLDDSPGRDAEGNPDKPAETRVARMGNWERDLSQVMTPTTAGAINEIMPMLNIIALKDFGRGINMQSMGTYDPVEHIDNPTGLRGTD